MGKQTSRSFTLIELLIVVAIIGILAALIIVSVNVALTNSKIARTKQDLQTFTRAVSIAEANTGKALMQITGSGCSECGFNGSNDIGENLNNLLDSNAGVQQWYNDLQAIQNACNGDCNNINTMKRDPWGNPYSLDENELEFSNDLCRRDFISSAGPDGIIDSNYNGGPGYTWNCAGDDICVELPFATGTCANG
ncbi:prepilin-type N-terminal cleavage/methylation domain-containing protein [Patescibacteria group bacterium]|nr:prepilin-type N-terminal cleavage/methylation domain-containing protein [Patescibacteria group bacterium]